MSQSNPPPIPPVNPPQPPPPPVLQPPPVFQPPPAFQPGPVGPYVPPYATPGGPYGAVPCPKCGSVSSQKVSFTWWGGMLGPRMLSHVKCNQCRTGFNGKTGKSNDTAILIYVVVGVVLVLVVVSARFMR